MAKRNVLIVEDDTKIAELLKDYFIKDGFNVSILNEGKSVTYVVRQNPPDAIVLDLMLPGKDGLKICKEIRSFSHVPILMLTAKVEESDRLIGFGFGADDYICKPFSPREVVSRVKTILRRKHSKYYPISDEEKIVAGPIIIMPERHKVIIGKSEINLTRIEFELLKILVSRPSYTFTRSDLFSKLQGNNYYGSERVIDSHIKNVRKKINEIVPGIEVIKTVYGIGYSFNEDLLENLTT